MKTPEIEVLEPELLKKEVTDVTTKTGVTGEAALAIKNQYKDHYFEILRWRSKAAEVGDPSDESEQKKAREIRLGLRKARCAVENTRKREKEGYLKASQFIDGLARVLKNHCEPIEMKLADVEKYAERMEEARQAKLVAERKQALLEADPECDTSTMNLGDMDEATWQAVLAGVGNARANREAEAKRIEEERIAKEKAEAEEREQIRKENEKLKAEVEAREKEMAKEREAREKLEKQERERQQAEYAEAEAEREAEKEAEAAVKRAPDRERLESFADALEKIDVPEMNTEAGESVADEVLNGQARFVTWVRQKANEL